MIEGVKGCLEDYKPSLPYNPLWEVKSDRSPFPNQAGTDATVPKAEATKVEGKPKVELKLDKAVFLAANPKGSSPLRLDEEYRRVSQALQRQKNKLERIELLAFWDIEPIDLMDKVEDEAPNILHFSGHGEKTSSKQADIEEKYEGYASTGAGIMVQDEKGEKHLIPSDAIEANFAYFKSEECCPQVVILNACHSQDQAIAIAKYADMVIGTSNKVNDKAAMYFAEGFYQGLAKGKTVESAFRRAKAVASSYVGTSQTAVFVLYKNGKIEEL